MNFIIDGLKAELGVTDDLGASEVMRAALRRIQELKLRLQDDNGNRAPVERVDLFDRESEFPLTRGILSRFDFNKAQSVMLIADMRLASVTGQLRIPSPDELRGVARTLLEGVERELIAGRSRREAVVHDLRMGGLAAIGKYNAETGTTLLWLSFEAVRVCVSY